MRTWLHILLLLAALAVASCSDDEPPFRPDTTPPAFLSGPTVSDIAQRSATVSWRTDDPSTSVVVFSRDSTFWSSDGVEIRILVKEHNVGIGETRPDVFGGMVPGSLYYYKAASQNAAGLMSWSTADTFTTLPDTTSP